MQSPLLEVFGAESGFVAANAAIASGHVDLVLIPEDFDGLTKKQCEGVLESYFLHLKRIIEGTDDGEDATPYANVVLAEGTAEILERVGAELDAVNIRKEDPDSKEKLFLGRILMIYKAKR